ncbi:PREDICTED: cancer-related nucleoside-triphosphatase homolog [Priapulus caudatus]|uniref:Cancer-related nucleoside-triphosphatase homolog n=1 Tax=Priapulus caudatus TaxID=37621 RepID=A0ABM1DV21_PRICU|nr:PREDICTED: cancer-related nucleoside-triphosphatase homolog [Priapulus caudatus]
MATTLTGGRVVLTGPPGIGKTTLVRKVCEALRSRNVNVQGFYTEEVRQGSHRIGFDVCTLDGRRACLARISRGGNATQQNRSPYQVGQYAVDLDSFEHLALSVLKHQENHNILYVVDEIGKMELFSMAFKKAVQLLYDSSSLPILATLPSPRGRPIEFVEAIRVRADVNVIEVTKSNRDHLLGDILTTLLPGARELDT